MSEYTKYGPIYWDIIQAWKGMEYSTCYNMDECWKHAKWKKPIIKGHISYDPIYMKYPD